MVKKQSPSAILNQINIQETTQPNDIRQLEQEAQRRRKHLENELLQQYIGLQRSWSKKIGWLLICSSVAIWLLLFFVGWECLNFKGYPWLLHTVVGTFFAQVVGLGLIVAKYLFTDR